MPQLILGLTGQIGSGKGYICEYLAHQYGAQVFKFSTYLSRVLDAMALEQSRDNLIKISESLRGTFGEHTLSHAISRDAILSDAPLAIVDGIRRIDDLAELEALSTFRLVAVDADIKTRYARVANRGEKTEENHLPWEEFLAQERRSTELTVPDTMTRASIHINNNGGTSELEEQIDALMKQFGIEKR